MLVAVVVVVTLLVVVAAVWLARFVRHPEQTATHDDERPDSTSDRFYGGADRPAGPDAEDPVGPARMHPTDPPD